MGRASLRNGSDCLRNPHAADLARLSAIVADRGRPLKHIQRARIVLLSAERLCVLDVAQQAGVSRPAVWRWLTALRRGRREGPLSATRPVRPATSHTPPTPSPSVLASPAPNRPVRSPHWTGAPWRRPSGSPCGRSSASGLPIASSRIGSAASNARTIQPSPRRSRTSSGSIWIRSRATPSCSRSTRRARSRLSSARRPSRPVTPGRPETQTHDYIRHGTTTLFAALDVLEAR